MFPEDPHTGDALQRIRIRVPDGADFTRIATASADHAPGTGLDLYVYDTDGTPVSESPPFSSDEHVDLPPGDYDVYVVQYALPEGMDSQRFTLWRSQIGPGDPSVPATVTPATRQVVAGRTGVRPRQESARADTGDRAGPSPTWLDQA